MVYHWSRDTADIVDRRLDKRVSHVPEVDPGLDVNMEERHVRRRHITPTHVKKYGPSNGCPSRRTGMGNDTERRRVDIETHLCTTPETN